MANKNMTFNIDEDLLYKLKLTATVQKKTQKELVEKYLREGLNRDENQTKLD